MSGRSVDPPRRLPRPRKVRDIEAPEPQARNEARRHLHALVDDDGARAKVQRNAIGLDLLQKPSALDSFAFVMNPSPIQSIHLGRVVARALDGDAVDRLVDGAKVG